MSTLVTAEAVAIFSPPNPRRTRWKILVGSCLFCGRPHLHWVRALDVVGLLNGEVVRRCHVNGDRYRLVEATTPPQPRRGRRARAARLAVGARP